MSVFIKSIAIIFLIISLLVGFVLMNSNWFLSTFPPNFLSGLIYLINPPKELRLDYDKELVVMDSGHGFVELMFTNNFYGKYVISLNFEKVDDISYAENTNIDVSYKIACSVSDDLVYEVAGKNASWGYILAYYSVPDDLPINKIINCQVEISDLSKIFYYKYKPAYITVNKISDI